MVIFHSYVSLPEGTAMKFFWFVKCAITLGIHTINRNDHQSINRSIPVHIPIEIPIIPSRDRRESLRISSDPISFDPATGGLRQETSQIQLYQKGALLYEPMGGLSSL